MQKRKTRRESESAADGRIEQAYAQALHTYCHRHNLTGIDKGFKYSDEGRTGVYSIRFHVNEKIGLENLAPADVFPTDILGIPTDVIEATYVPHRLVQEQVIERRRRVVPLRPGISVAHPNVTAGTLGAIVFDNATGRPCILSNWHVLVGAATARPGDPIVQPGPLDGGRAPRDTIAHLERSILGADGDAAIGILNDTRAFDIRQAETDTKIVSARMPIPGEILEKSGRTTGVTRAKVDGVGRYFITYSVGRIGVDGFKLVPIEPDNPDDEEVSSGGDSGSLWYSAETGEGIGLHFGGETDPDPRAENALACHLPTVLRELDVTLVQPIIEVTPTLPVLLGGRTNGTNGDQNANDAPREGVLITSQEHSFGAFDIDIRIRFQPQTPDAN